VTLTDFADIVRADNDEMLNVRVIRLLATLNAQVNNGAERDAAEARARYDTALAEIRRRRVARGL
jgi:hypothetical protein